MPWLLVYHGNKDKYNFCFVDFIYILTLNWWRSCTWIIYNYVLKMPPLYPETSFSNSKSGYLNKGHLCSAHREMFSTSGVSWVHRGGGISWIHRGNIMSASGDITSTSHEYIGGWLSGSSAVLSFWVFQIFRMELISSYFNDPVFLGHRHSFWVVCSRVCSRLFWFPYGSSRS